MADKLLDKVQEINKKHLDEQVARMTARRNTILQERIKNARTNRASGVNRVVGLKKIGSGGRSSSSKKKGFDLSSLFAGSE